MAKKPRAQQVGETITDYIRYRVRFAQETGQHSFYRIAADCGISLPNLSKWAQTGAMQVGRRKIDAIAEYLGVRCS